MSVINIQDNNSVKYDIYSKHYIQGMVKISVITVTAGYMPLQIFIRTDNTKTVVESCGGVAESINSYEKDYISC
jgi:hypothetical protein